MPGYLAALATGDQGEPTDRREAAMIRLRITLLHVCENAILHLIYNESNVTLLQAYTE